ncbi:MAG TPA: alpha/beta fold hydrolase [Polyangiaceae bacterium]|jgi:haloalkane dehalogenase|nr:alpha/beta fold hydrolase [Polyangiaceae bacterium]
MSNWLDPQLYPFAPKRFQSSGGVLSYLDEGQGAPILFVHGTPSWSFEWRAVIRTLAAQARCIAPDHLGFGLSDKPSAARLDPEQHAQRLGELIDALDLQDVTLVVHDFGGPIGIGAVLPRLERIRRIVVLNSWCWSNAQDRAVRRLDRLINSWLGRFLYLCLNASPRWLLPASFGDRTKLTPRIHAQYLGPFLRRNERAGTYALARALLGSDGYYARLWAQRHLLKDKLTQILWGERDPAFKAVHLEQWQQAFPRARVTRLAQVGHFVGEEAPDALVRALSDAV